MSARAENIKVRECLAAIPGGEAEGILPGPAPVAVWMHRGLDASSFRLRRSAQACFVKLYDPARFPEGDVAAIAESSARAAALGIAPDLLYRDDKAGIILFEDLTESHVAALRPWFDQGENLRATLSLLRRWHEEGTASRACSWLADLARNLSLAEARAKADPDPAAALLPSWGRIVDLADLVTERLAGDGFARTPLHGAMLMSNLLRPLDAGGKPLLCDFDHSVMGDPLRDLASLWLEVSGRFDEIAVFAPQGADAARRLTLWAVAEDLGQGLDAWEAHFSGRNAEVEYFKYARFRLNRALMNGHRAGLLPAPEDLSW